MEATKTNAIQATEVNKVNSSNEPKKNQAPMVIQKAHKAEPRQTKNEAVTEEAKPKKKKTNPIKAKLQKEKALTPNEKKAIKEAKKQTEASLVEEVISKREVKYIYPEDCQDTLSRKKFRQQVRNKLHQLELEMLRIEDKASKAFKTKEKEYNSYKNKYIKKGAAA